MRSATILEAFFQAAISRKVTASTHIRQGPSEPWRASKEWNAPGGLAWRDQARGLVKRSKSRTAPLAAEEARAA